MKKYNSPIFANSIGLNISIHRHYTRWVFGLVWNCIWYKLEESKRSVAVLGDWSEGLGFGINQAVWTNIPKTI